MAIWTTWVCDATMGWPPCFCPIDGDIDGEFQIITGINVVSRPQGVVVAVVHEAGNEAVNAFMEKHGDELQHLLSDDNGKA